MGEIVAREGIPAPGTPEHLARSRLQLKLGNRDLYGRRLHVGRRGRHRADASIRPTRCTSSAGSTARSSGCPVSLSRRGPRRSRPAPMPCSTALPAAGREGRRAIARRSGASSGARSVRSTTGSSRSGCVCAGSTWTPRASPGRTRPASGRPSSKDLAALKARYALLEERPGADRRARRRVSASRCGRRTARRRICRRSTCSGCIRPNRLSTSERASVYASRLWEFLSGDPARVEHRGRRLPGDLRHGDDGAPHERRGRAVRRPGGALPARVRPAGRAGAHRAHRRQQPRGRAVDRLRRVRPRASSSTSSAARSTGSSIRSCCRRRPSAPAASCGRR